MALYGGSILETNSLNGVPLMDLLSGASTGTSLFEFTSELWSVATINPGGSFGLGRASGVVQASPNYLTAYEGGDISLSSMAHTWTVAPAVPTQVFRLFSPSAALGGGVIWSFPRGIRIAPNASIVMASFGVIPVYNHHVSMEIDE